MAALAVAGFVAEKISRGIVMRPVRALAGTVGITISPPTLTDEERKQARMVVKEWREECLKAYPILAVEPNPVPDEENGFLLLCRLDQRMDLPNESREILNSINKGFDLDAGRKLIEQHDDVIKHIEHIASLPKRSSFNLPDDYFGFIGAMDCKLATELLLLKASLAAHEGDDETAFHCVRLTGNLADHLREIETPYLLSETVAILIELSRQSVVLEQILPKLDPKTGLQVWHDELNLMGQLTNQRFADLMRGEWQTSSMYVVFPMIAEMDYSGEIGDGKSCVMVYSEWMTEMINAYQSAGPHETVRVKDQEEDFAHLNRDQREIMSLMSIGANAWSNGFRRSAVVTACSLAALELLMLEQQGETLTAESALKVTKDPLTGTPFILDPSTRYLTVTNNEVCENVEPVKLPWGP